MKKLTVTMIETSAETAVTTPKMLTEMAKLLKTAIKNDISETLQITKRKKCLSVEYKGCTFYMVRDIQELKEELAKKKI